MKALRKIASGVGHVELSDVPVPEIGPNEVLMKVYAAGICGSDLLIQEDRHFYRAPVTQGQIPLSTNESSAISARKTGRDRCCRLVDRCEIPTVANDRPDTKSPRSRSFNGPFSDWAIRRQAPVRWVM